MGLLEQFQNKRVPDPKSNVFGWFASAVEMQDVCHLAVPDKSGEFVNAHKKMTYFRAFR